MQYCLSIKLSCVYNGFSHNLDFNPPSHLANHTWMKISFDILGDDFDDRYCKEYIEIEESKYDNRSSSASDLTKRPLGFMSVVIPFVTNNADARNPCFKISLDNKTMQTVQVLVRTAHNKLPLKCDNYSVNNVRSIWLA